MNNTHRTRALSRLSAAPQARGAARDRARVRTIKNARAALQVAAGDINPLRGMGYEEKHAAWLVVAGWDAVPPRGVGAAAAPSGDEV